MMSNSRDLNSGRETYIRVQEIITLGKRIVVKFECSKNLQLFFKKDHLDIEYVYGEDVSLLNDLKVIPKSVLVIPFLGNVMPIVWLNNASIYLDELDKNFFEALPEIKFGYQQMYPNLDFKGDAVVSNIVDNSKCEKSFAGGTFPNRSISFFSAGVDAWDTLLSNLSSNPVLLTIYGMDFYLENKAGNQFTQNLMKNIADHFKTESISVFTQMRQFINEEALNEKFAKELGFHWFHRIQHGFGAITHAAPISWLLGSKEIFFASSYSFKDRVVHKCASDPRIDNCIKFCGAKVIHDGYDLSRQDKIYDIVKYASRNHYKPYIHVCWNQDKTIKNCCRCEKCLRTIFGILAEGGEPSDYGFDYSNPALINRRFHWILSHGNLELTGEMWEQILYRFKMNPGIVRKFPELKWTLDKNLSDFHKPSSKIFQIILRLASGFRSRFLK